MDRNEKQTAIMQSLCLFTSFLLVSCQFSGEKDFGGYGDSLFDEEWRFMKGDIANAERPDFDDSDWRELTIPHDWNIEPHAVQNDKYIGPFTKGTKDSTSTGNFDGGIGWYRKYFTVEKNDAGKVFYLCLDGVSVQSDVWVNGHHMGFHPNGYTPFNYNITKYLNAAGKENVVAIKTVNTGDNSRWYPGAGLYRHIRLSVSEPVYIEPWGVFITTPDVDAKRSTVNVDVAIRNDSDDESDVATLVTLFDREGRIVAYGEERKTCLQKNNIMSTVSLDVDQPKLWSPDSPALYTAEIKIFTGDKPSDIQYVKFGIRSIDFSVENGFLLNGERTILKGACIHHDNGLLGSATFDKAEFRRVEVLKNNGFNAIRTAHNLPSSQFLDACDSLGMLVLDEVFDMWVVPKRQNDYHLYFEEWSDRDMASMVLRDRNHPSVIMWSIGNELPERTDSVGFAIAKRLYDVAKIYDKTRPVTQAITSYGRIPKEHWDSTARAFALSDVASYNYLWKHYERDHGLYPDRIMMSSESTATDAFINWRMANEKSYVLGDFIWTGMDYIGEVGIGNARYDKPDGGHNAVKPWPWYLSWCGDIDISGNKKPQSYYRDVVWGESDLEILVHTPVPEGKVELVTKWGWPDEYPHWNWPDCENVPLPVNVYANFDTVRLLHNGNLIGEKAITREENLTATFMVEYQPGELTAVGIRNGKEVLTKSLITAGQPAKIRIIPEQTTVRANINDLAYVQIEILDEDGRLVPDAEVKIQLLFEGPGKLIACGNASPFDLESFNNPNLKSFRGRALAILQPGDKQGVMTLKVKAEGMQNAEVKIRVE